MLMRTKPSSYAVMNVILAFVLALSGLLGYAQPASAEGTISLTTLGTAYSQNFDTLALSGTSSTVPTGWDFIETGTNANTTYTAGTGSGNAGDTYSFGASSSTERAFGGLLSGSLVPTIGASFTNNTGSVINSLEISYTGEQWRLGATGRTDRLDFQYSLDATSLNTGTWTDVDALDFHGPISTGTLGPLNGNDSANQAAVSASITGLSIANGATVWIRWSDFNASGADDGMAVDNFSLTPSGEVVVSDPVINEFVVNHVGTDTHEYVEIFGDPNTDYSAFSILQIEGDTTGAGVVDSVHTPGTTNTDGYWFTGFLGNAFENGTVTLLLVEGFSGAVGDDLDTDNDGVFNVTPWNRLADDVAVNDGGAGDRVYASTILAPGFSGSAFSPGGASRIPNGVDTGSVDDWTVNDFDGEGLPGFTGTPVPGEAVNTPGAVNALVDFTPIVVINEIDYDQPSTDTAEFVELKNNSNFAINLAGFTLELVNGNSGGAVIYNTIILPAVELPIGGYYVICANAATVASCDLDASPNTDFIQNGAPDAVGLRYNGELVDAVSYEGNTGSPYTEGSGVGLVDSGANPGEGISRCPDGFDSDQNNIDFALVNSTPGMTNACEASVILSINDVSLNEGNSGTISFDFTVSLSAPAPAGGVTFDIATADGTATAPVDYTANSLTGQSIPAGSSTYNFSVLVNGDTIAEPDETFFVNVTNVVGAGVVDGVGQGTIVNDDGLFVSRIHAIQGSGSTAAPGTFTVEAIVVGDYQTQGTGQLRGFFVQEEDADTDENPATSEGIFVFCTTCPVPVSVGDLVRVTGSSSEFFDMSQLTASTVASVTVLSTDNPLPTPASIPLPVPGVPNGDLAAATAAINAYYESFEGMLVTFPAALSVSEYFELARYGQVILTEGGRPHTYTAVNTPTTAGFIEHQINLATRKVILDDTDNVQNRPVNTPNTAYYHPVPGLSTSNYFRGGDTITNLTGVLHWSFAGQGGTDAWRIRPVVDAYSYAFTPVNPRPAVPTVDGSLKVASFNVLNYFLTIDTTLSNDIGSCGPSGTADCRGADSAQELERQRTKLLAALSAIDADVFGFMEMENTPGVEPLADIVAGLPGYDYIDTSAIGTDAIRLGIIYKTATVTPVGSYAVLTSTVDPRFVDTRNRPALAQSFEEISSGARLTVVVNHLKSKGSGCGAGDDDTTTGQGNCNGTRTLAAQALADWLATDPTGSGDADVLIIGDLNSYAKEDPIVALQNAGYTDLVAAFGGPSAYGYVFDGQLGYLDHALSNASLTPQVAGVAEWHINADEIPLFDYNDDVRDPGESAFEEESDVFPLYEPNEFRTSDHDPVIIGLNLNGRPSLTADPIEQSVQYSDPIADVTVTASDVSADLLDFTYQWNFNGGDPKDGLPEVLSFTDPDCSEGTCELTLSGVALLPPGVYVVRVTATDEEGLFSSIDIVLIVTQEDARAFYTGAEFASTANETSSTATVTLSATVQDISVTTDAGGDEYPGDITNAIVTFVDRDKDDAVLCTAPVGLVDQNDPTTGTATCNLDVVLGSNDNSVILTVGVVVSGYYTRDSGSDNGIVTVSRPLTTNFITGGGSLLLENSAGLLAGDPGSRNNFGLNVKFNKGGKNLQGRVSTLVRSDGRTYQIKSSALTSLSVQPCPQATPESPCTAVFNGKATIQDITDPDNPIAIDGNATLQVTLTDAGNAGDSIAITVWNKQGGLWYASNWDGTRTLEQYLASGNVIVH